MGKTQILCAALAGAFGVSTVPTQAQEGGTILTFGIEQRLEVTDNLPLDIVSAGTSTVATSRLTFGLTSTTRTQRFALEGGAALRAIDWAGQPSETIVDDPHLTFAYTRQGARSLIEAGARYRRSEIEFLDAFENAINDEGEIDLPDDFGELTGTGTRESYGANLSLAIGPDAPFGVTFGASLSGLSYTDATDPDLFDNERRIYDATAHLRFSPTTVGTVSLTRQDYEAEDPESTNRETDSVTFGVTHEVSEVLTLDASIGHTVVDTTETVGMVTTTTREEGINGRLGLDYGLPNGSLTAAVEASTDEDGTRVGFELGRNMELPDGSLSASVGVTQLEDQDPELTASLNWQKELPNGEFNAHVRRAITTDSSDNDTLTTAVILGYEHNLNNISGLMFNLSYARTDETGPAGQTDVAGFSAIYRRDVTRDWDLNVGYAYRMRDEDGLGSADSQTVFVTLSREFSGRP